MWETHKIGENICKSEKGWRTPKTHHHKTHNLIQRWAKGPAFGRWMQENHEFEASVGYIVRPCLKKKKKKKERVTVGKMP
jgi:hypothetical protein